MKYRQIKIVTDKGKSGTLNEAKEREEKKAMTESSQCKKK